jgi:hypothetical protein
MGSRRSDRPRGRLIFLAVGAYAVFLATAPFAHHDLLCHLKTPQHCTSCVSSPLSVNPHTGVALDTWSLADAGRALLTDPISQSALLPTSSSGRSPPVSARSLNG